MRQKALNFLSNKKSVGPLIDDLNIYKSFRQVLNSGIESVTQPYSQNVWVYASVSTISQSMSRVPLRIYKEGKKSKKDGKGQNIVIEQGPLYELFNNPNPFLSPEQLIEGTAIYLMLRGECMWVLEGRDNITQIPKEIWVLEPDRFEYIIDPKTSFPIGWNYRVGPKTIPFRLDEVIHFKLFNPYNILRGLTPIQAAQAGIDQDFYASQYNKSFFKEGAVAGGFIKVPEFLDDDEYNKLINGFEERHKGMHKAFKVGVLQGNADFKEVRMSQKDMDFVNTKKLTRAEIFAAYKVNEVVLGLYEDIKSYEGIRAAHRTFWLDCLVPKLNYIEGMLWSKLFSKIEGGASWGGFDYGPVEALREDFDKKVETSFKLFQMGYPINIINSRLDLGLPDVGWGNTGFIPGNLVPIGKNGLPLKPNEPNEPDKPDEPEEPNEPDEPDEPEGPGEPNEPEEGKFYHKVKCLLKEMQVNREGKEDDKDILFKRFFDRQIPIEKEFDKKVKKFFFEQRKISLESLFNTFKSLESDMKTREISDYMFNAEAEILKLREILMPLYLEAIRVGAEMVAEEVGNTIFKFEPISPEFLEIINSKVRNIPKEIVETVKSQLQATLIEGIIKGETVNELADRVRKVYNFATNRSITIARTESATSINAGRYEMYKQEGIIKHQWVTARDEKVRSSHRLLDGSITKIGDFFIRSDNTISALRYPGDMEAPAGEVISCRCLSLPVLGEE